MRTIETKGSIGTVGTIRTLVLQESLKMEKTDESRKISIGTIRAVGTMEIGNYRNYGRRK